MSAWLHLQNQQMQRLQMQRLIERGVPPDSASGT
jgi:hypothetical protein